LLGGVAGHKALNDKKEPTMKYLLALLSLVCVSAQAARTVTIAPITAYTGRGIVLDGTLPYTVTPARDGTVTVTQGSISVVMKGEAFSARYAGTWPAPTCPGKPPVATRSVQCPAGTSGTWTQTQDWTSVAYPICWQIQDWEPPTPPAGVCGTPPPPPPPPPTGTLTIDLSYVDTAGAAFTKFKNWVGLALAGHPDYLFSAVDAAYMFKLTGQQQYATLAIQTAEAQVAAAEAKIAANQNPDVSGDSYLNAGGMIADVALTYAWCNQLLTDSQKTRWVAYEKQTVFNIWHPNQAVWGGRSATWSGWAVNDPANNYYYSFVRATMFYALSVNDGDLIMYLRTDRLPLLTNFYATLPGGGSLEGSGYGSSHMGLFELYQVWKDSGQGDLANGNTHLTNSINVWVHGTTPTLDHFYAAGDQARVSEPTIYDYQRRIVLEAARLTNTAVDKATGAWWLGHIVNGSAGPDQMQNGFNLRYNLIPHDVVSTPPQALTYRAAEVGEIFSRTDWTASASWINVIMGLYNQSHAHQEQGAFTLYKNTWLAVSSNIWSHSGINQGTDSNNVIRFEKSGAVQPQSQGATRKVNVTSYTSSNGDLHVTGDITPTRARACRTGPAPLILLRGRRPSPIVRPSVAVPMPSGS
jgi:hypothetical protein